MEDKVGATTGQVEQTAMQVVTEHLRDVVGKAFQTNNWGQRHVAAWEGIPGLVDAAVRRREFALKTAIVGWALIGETHEQMHGSKMGEDGFLGPAWRAMGEGLRDQLNGQCGRFDQGTLDALICNIARACGVPLGE